MISAFLLENSNLEIDEKKEKVINIVKKMIIHLDDDNEKIYKCFDYDAVRIIDFHKKSLNGSIVIHPISSEDMSNCIEKIRSIFQVISVNKSQLEEEYYRFKKIK